MPRAVLTWIDDGQLCVATIPQDAAASIGRATDATVSIDLPALSRQHARVVRADGRFVLEHLSQTNPTLVNGEAVATSQPLADHDVVEAGPAAITFHDLDAAARELGVACHHCARENPVGQYDCWYCGSSLVNAPTMVGRQSVVCRVVSADGERFDLLASNTLTFDGEGAASMTMDDAEGPDDSGPRIEPRGGELWLQPADRARVNGEAPSGEHRIAFRDVVEVGSRRYLCIPRAD